MLATKPTNKSATMEKGISLLKVLCLTFIGYINEVIPKINKIFAIFEPKIFPTAISEASFELASMLTRSSGILVPIETIVRPTTRSEILFFFAIQDEPITNQSAPFISIRKPTTKRKKLSISVWQI